MHPPVSTLLDYIRTSQDIGAVLARTRDFAYTLGAVRHSYHFTPAYGSPTAYDTVISSDGFPAGWVQAYSGNSLRLSDPFPRIVVEHGPILTMEQALEFCDDSPEVARLVSAIKEFGLENAIGMALFGPHNRVTYATFGFAEKLDQGVGSDMLLLFGLMQAAHVRICTLLDRLDETPALSVRELEVLESIAKGHSRKETAQILEISPETVRTYTKRVFDKLGTSERVGATVKALKLGLIQP